ncbi:MAG: hypothetical protein SPL42_09885 [Bacteroidales bacterium]|nr:hypothetical protein [Bacteroidales bacterium]MDY6348715.1 hypothetical protein [Bacteroidales bacterium]
MENSSNDTNALSLCVLTPFVFTFISSSTLNPLSYTTCREKS